MKTTNFPDQIFKEYDIRGLFEKEFSEELIKKLGYEIGLKIKKYENKVCVGYDCRTHSPQCFKWLISGLNYAGLKIINLKEVPTPVTYYSGYIEELNCKSNIMITASHNPKEYNGFKITIDNKAYFGEEIQELKNEIIKCEETIPNNYKCEKFDIITPYVELLTKKFQNLKNYKEKILFDCGNGMTGPTLKKILNNLNLNYEIMYEKPNGEFPNHPADPSKVANLKEIIEKQNQNNIELGLAFDGDSDRIGITQKSGQIDPDTLAILIAKTLKNPKVIGEVKCSQIMYEEINKIGSTLMSKTGHSNIKKLIRENPDTNFAVELSGHIFFNDKYFGYDDAIYAALRVIKLKVNKMNFKDEIKKLPKTFSTLEGRIDVDEERKFAIIKEFKEQIKNSKENLKYKNLIETDGLRIEFENGWGLVRASNTGPKLSTRFEAKSQKELNTIETKLMNILNNIIEK